MGQASGYCWMHIILMLQNIVKSSIFNCFLSDLNFEENGLRDYILFAVSRQNELVYGWILIHISYCVQEIFVIGFTSYIQ